MVESAVEVKSDFELFERLLHGEYKSKSKKSKKRRHFDKTLTAVRIWVRSPESKRVTEKDELISRSAASSSLKAKLSEIRSFCEANGIPCSAMKLSFAHLLVLKAFGTSERIERRLFFNLTARLIDVLNKNIKGSP